MVVHRPIECPADVRERKLSPACFRRVLQADTKPFWPPVSSQHKLTQPESDVEHWWPD